VKSGELESKSAVKKISIKKVEVENTKDAHKNPKKIVPLDQLPDDVKAKILLKKEKNRLRRQKEKKIHKLRQEENKLLTKEELEDKVKSTCRKKRKRKSLVGEDSSVKPPELQNKPKEQSSGGLKKKLKLEKLKQRTKNKKKVKSSLVISQAVDECENHQKEIETKNTNKESGPIILTEAKCAESESKLKKKNKLQNPKERKGKIEKKLVDLSETKENEKKGSNSVEKSNKNKMGLLDGNVNKAAKMEKKKLKMAELRKRSKLKKKMATTEINEKNDVNNDINDKNESVQKVTKTKNDDKVGEFNALVKNLKNIKKKMELQPADQDISQKDQSKECNDLLEGRFEPNSVQITASPNVVSKPSKSQNLKSKLIGQLEGAKFRFINEQLYTMDSEDAVSLFAQDSEAFEVYHRRFAQQIAKWPVNPVDLIIKALKTEETAKKIVDFGCGEAKLAKELSKDGVHQVTSYDLVAANELVEVCDMKRCPLQDASVDVVVFCLALMGTNLVDFIREANRILKQDGILKIAEVESRCNDLKQFIRDLGKCGFNLIDKNVDHKVFFLLDFKKVGIPRVSDAFPLSLEPCYYKKR